MEKTESSWRILEDMIKRCRKCTLWKTKTNYVIGSGSRKSKILFIGEAPGKNEDVIGEPFVGRSGKLLDEMLNDIGLKRKDIYIANVIKCRPPDNRDPTNEEKEKCSSYLKEQINILKPKLIVALGRHSMEYLFNEFEVTGQSIGSCHGKVFQIINEKFIGNIMILYHPAVAIYNNNRKQELFEDFQKIKEFI